MAGSLACFIELRVYNSFARPWRFPRMKDIMNRDIHSIRLKALLAVLALGLACQSCGFNATRTPPASSTSTGTPERNVFYVSESGSDANPGTQARPWRTIQKAADSTTPGAAVIVLAGNYNERIKVQRSGRIGMPVRFEAQGHARTRGFTVSADFVTIRGFEITDTPDDARDGWGVWAQGSNLTIEDNYVHDATRGGIVLFAPPDNEAITHDCSVRNNRLDHNALVGVETHGQNNLVEGNEIWGTIQYHPKWLNPPEWVDADGIRFFGSGHVIRKNYIHDILYGVTGNVNPHIDCLQTWADGSYHKAASNVVIEQNLCVNMQAQSPLEVGKALMIEDAHDLVIRNNIFRSYRVIQAINSNSLEIVNNVFTNRLDLSAANGPSMITLTNTPNTVIKNNIFYDPLLEIIYYDGASRGGINIGYNNTFRSDGQSTQDAPYPNDLWNVDPLFLNASAGDFHLQAASPLIDRGAGLPNVPADYDGTLRPQGAGYDIGAFEWHPQNGLLPRAVRFASFAAARLFWRATRPPGTVRLFCFGESLLCGVIPPFEIVFPQPNFDAILH